MGTLFAGLDHEISWKHELSWSWTRRDERRHIPSRCPVFTNALQAIPLRNQIIEGDGS